MSSAVHRLQKTLASSLSLVERQGGKTLTQSLPRPKNLPEELESLVRDLWALRLQKLQNRVLYDTESETETQSQQVFSSQSEGDTSASESSHASRRRSAKKAKGTPNLSDLLALCYVGTLLLREPVTVADLHGWVTHGELLYYRAAKEVPLDMRERLPPTYQDQFEPHHVGPAQKLHQNVVDTLKVLDDSFGMAMPPINHPLILYRWVRDLSLPIEIFAATTNLARALELDFAYRLDVPPATKGVELRFPELRLMTLLVAATKLLYPCDEIARYSTSATNVSAISMDWSAWANLQTFDDRTDRHDEPPLPFQTAVGFGNADILAASEQQLDGYLDWFEHNLASEDIRETRKAGKDIELRRTLFGMFPAHGVDAASTERAAVSAAQSDDVSDRLRRSQTLLRSRPTIKVMGSGDMKEIGSFYRRFRSVDELVGPVKVLYQRAAGLAGFSLAGMVRAVVLVEQKMQNMEESMRKPR
ncbi:hypothetical protein BAUCODRAFT_34214 [Baudoinia panamericana UAMH 10762]|uniref:Uncharacterized protein n=1 Tax=Baudoinia panamericana (strain UAMH 10762) TaxID=717646 RepID=M2MYY2_BAUPA|nr:uncharacterized protein BAUCODRAFT_34214 [Baudoinia panamericana UAMH 10762]EMC96823.1 hypothetical protein BAUCODRAFT_34214 [Baudoinia panamericana UAMH 10762]